MLMMILIDNPTLTGDHLGRAQKGKKEACVCASNNQVNTKRLQTLKKLRQVNHIPNCFVHLLLVWKHMT